MRMNWCLLLTFVLTVNTSWAQISSNIGSLKSSLKHDSYRVLPYAKHVASSRRKLRGRSDGVLELAVPHAWGSHENTKGSVRLMLSENQEILHPNFEHIVYQTVNERVESQMSGESIRACLFKGHILDASGAKLEQSSATVTYCEGGFSVSMTRHADDDASVAQLLEGDSRHLVVHRRSALSEEFSCAVQPRAANDKVDLFSTAEPMVPRWQEKHEHALSTVSRVVVQGDDNSTVSGAGPSPFEKPREIEKELENREGDASNQKVVELLIVNPSRRFRRFGERVHIHSATLISQVQSLYDRFSADYKITFVIVGMITFIEDDPFEQNDRNNIDETLAAFNSWRTQALQRGEIPNHDLAHFISGGDFFTVDTTLQRELENVVGLAHLDGVCGDNRAGVSQGTSYSDQFVSGIIAHEIGHNLGIRHTDEYWSAGLVKEPCFYLGSGFIMNRASSGIGDWSQCSRGWLSQFFEGVLEERIAPGYGKGGESLCLDDVPERSHMWTSDAQGATCGNGLREEGEECDCLNNDCAGLDPCCDAGTCRLKEAAVCSALDGCCDPGTCAPRETGFVCRSSKDATCDTVEVCDGVAPTCPRDQVAAVGTVCEQNTVEGTCYGGKCVTYDAQCLAISPFVDDSTGTRYEFTGISTAPIGNFCGNLQCAFIRPAPGNNAVQISRPEGTVTVADGTPCEDTGNGVEVCFRNRCTPAAQVRPSPAQTCDNSVLDGDETDVDCGGEFCLPCLESSACLADADCAWPMACEQTSGLNKTSVCTDSFVLPRPDPSDLPSALELWVQFNFELFIAVCVFGSVFLLALSVAVAPCRFLLGEDRERQVRHARSTVVRGAVDAPRTVAARVREGSFRVADQVRRGSLEIYDSIAGPRFAEYTASIEKDDQLLQRHRPYSASVLDTVHTPTRPTRIRSSVVMGEGRRHRVGTEQSLAEVAVPEESSIFRLVLRPGNPGGVNSAGVDGDRAPDPPKHRRNRSDVPLQRSSSLVSKEDKSLLRSTTNPSFSNALLLEGRSDNGVVKFLKEKNPASRPKGRGSLFSFLPKRSFLVNEKEKPDTESQQIEELGKANTAGHNEIRKHRKGTLSFLSFLATNRASTVEGDINNVSTRPPSPRAKYSELDPKYLEEMGFIDLDSMFPEELEKREIQSFKL